MSSDFNFERIGILLFEISREFDFEIIPDQLSLVSVEN